MILSLYVDDLIITGNNQEMIENFKKNMKKEFEMTDLGLMNYFLGLEVKQTLEDIFISQRKYADAILKRFKMDKCKVMTTPLAVNEKLFKEDEAEKADYSTYRGIVGCLLYLTASRPDLMFSASLLSRFMQSPSQLHHAAAKRVLRYLRGTKDLGIWYKPTEKLELVGFSYSDWGGSIDDMRSTSGYAFTLGSGVFSWQSQKQDNVAQSTTEAECIAACAAVNQAIWLRKVLKDMGKEQFNPTRLLCDSKSAIAIAKNPFCHKRTKHFKIKYHFVRDSQREGEINLEYCPSEEQVADIFTKALPKQKFEELRNKLGMLQLSVKEEC
ncbi:hypothetical protein RND81_01G144300 [Saponaria officinalis]|uniref:Reverse transcriptase Ty1/copia-type domain-containing protein n=1 Tax=Saponaria officinalis TaxID=3572 RepID=A0AAW1NFB2_SAPOF